MAYLRYGDLVHDIADSDVDALVLMIGEALNSDEARTVNLTKSNGEKSQFFITPGVPISVHTGQRPNS